MKIQKIYDNFLKVQSVMDYIPSIPFENSILIADEARAPFNTNNLVKYRVENWYWFVSA